MHAFNFFALCGVVGLCRARSCFVRHWAALNTLITLTFVIFVFNHIQQHSIAFNKRTVKDEALNRISLANSWHRFTFFFKLSRIIAKYSQSQSIISIHHCDRLRQNEFLGVQKVLPPFKWYIGWNYYGGQRAHVWSEPIGSRKSCGLSQSVEYHPWGWSRKSNIHITLLKLNYRNISRFITFYLFLPFLPISQFVLIFAIIRTLLYV